LTQLVPPPLELDQDEKEKQLQLLGRHRTQSEIMVRAKIIILASEGNNHRQIGQ